MAIRPVSTQSAQDCSSPPKTTSDVADCLKAHYKGYIEWDNLNRLLEQLPVRLQQVINVYYGQWHTLDEAAEIMGCSSSSIKRYLRQARKDILKLLT